MAPLVLTIRPQKTSEWTLPRPHKVGFLHLPREIRDQIYEYVLIDPIPRWDKRHRLDCKFKTFDPAESEPPPFAMTRVTFVENPFRMKQYHSCGCAKRSGLNLLGASRQIHEEASPVFWSRNTFCFLAAGEFCLISGNLMSSKQQGLIQSISIMPPGTFFESGHVRYFLSGHRYSDFQFWEDISIFKGLKYLEVEPWALGDPTSSDWVEFLTSSMPELKINLVSIYAFCADEWWTFPLVFEGHDFLRLQRGTIYAKISWPLVPSEDYDSDTDEWLEPRLSDRYRRTALDMTEEEVDVEAAVVYDFFGFDPNVSAGWLDDWKIKEGFDEFHDEFVVTRPEKSPLKLKLYGLPSSSETALQAYQQKTLRDIEQMAINGLTLSQNEASQKTRERKRELRRDAQTKQVPAWKERHSESSGTQNDLKPTVARLKEQKAAARRKRRSEKQNAEIRKQERKRVQTGHK